MGLSKHMSPTVTLVTIATIVTVGSAYLCYRKSRNRMPEKWTAVGKVKELFIYPLKSGKAMEIESADCTEYGVRIYKQEVELRDRCFVVYRADNYEARATATFPKLTLIEVSVNGNSEFVFKAPGQGPLVVKIPDLKKKPINVTLSMKEPCEAVDCGDEAAVWVSTYIKDKPTGLRLGYHRGIFKRDIEKFYSKFTKVYRLNNNCGGLYQNLTSYHLVAQPSVDALNTHLTEPVTARNFRPNILVDGKDLPAHVEEDWDWIKIGDVVFRTVRPCVRCVTTAVDTEKGVISRNRDPLATLERTNNLKKPAHIKCDGKRGVMGIQIGIEKLGQIKVGDQVYVG